MHRQKDGRTEGRKLNILLSLSKGGIKQVIIKSIKSSLQIQLFLTGTHWLWEITKMLVKRSAEYEHLPKESVMLEFHMPEEFDDLESPRVLNTHLDFDQLPIQIFQKNCKIIHIQRNPKDVAVSQFCHRTHANIHVTKEWGQFVRLFETESGKISFKTSDDCVYITLQITHVINSSKTHSLPTVYSVVRLVVTTENLHNEATNL